MRVSRRIVPFLLLMLLAALPLAAQDGNAIDIGETVEGELTRRTQSVEYTFEGEAGQVIVITLVSEDFDTFLVLQGTDGVEMAVDDDSGPGDLDSRIGPVVLPNNGEYTIIADSYNHYYNAGDSSVVGAFELEVDGISSQRIEYTQDVKGELTRADTQVYYLFRGQVGDVVTIVMAPEDFDAYVTLTQGSTALYSADGSYTEDGSAIISGYTLPSTGDYIITASSLNEEGTGEFMLSIDRAQVTELAYGDSVEAALTSDERVLYYTFEGAVGDIVDVTVDSGGEFDTTLTINGPDNYQVAYSDDFNGLDPAVQSLILSQSGRFTILVQPYQADATGDLTVTLDRGEIVSLDDGAQRVRFSNGDTQETLMFEGEQGDTVRLTVEVIKGDLAAPSINITQGTSTPVYISASGIVRQSFDFVIPEDGAVYVRIDEYSYTDVTLDVSLERLADEDGDAGDADVEEEATSEPEAEAEEVEPVVEATAQAEATAEAE